MSEHTPSLKPCPFCGAGDHYGGVQLLEGGDEGGLWNVGCWQCGATIEGPRPTRAEAITAWNTRASHAALKAALERAIALEPLEIDHNPHCGCWLCEARRALSEA